MTNIKRQMEECPALGCILQVFNDADYQAHLVGGAVRNIIMGRPVKDYDIATNAHPQHVMTMFKDLGLTVHPTGIDHGTVTVIMDGVPFEITTWRRDVQTDGRRAVIEFADTMKDDAERRDFTFNALYADINGDVADPTEWGIIDATRAEVHFIGDAETRIREDALRILRYFRFSAAYAGEVNMYSDDYRAIVPSLHMVRDLSRERIGMEMMNLFAQPSIHKTLLAMQMSGLLDIVMPGISIHAIIGFQAYEQIEREMNLDPDPVRRMAYLTRQPLTQELALSKKNTKAHLQLKTIVESSMSPGEMGYRYGVDVAVDAMCIMASKGLREFEASSMDEVVSASKKAFPVKAVDLQKKYAGGKLGQALRDTEKRWIDSGFTMTKSSLLSKV